MASTERGHVATGARRELRADCARCAGLCCVAPPFQRSADFAIDKPAGEPCPHLRADFRCEIHDRLRPAGFPGCDVFDCFGAGQRIVQVTFGGRSWRESRELAPAMFAALPVMRQLHEMLWYLAEVLALPAAAEVHTEAEALQARTEALAGSAAHELAMLDVGAVRRPVGELLERASALARGGSGPDRRGADLAGASLRGAALAGADLRGALLIGTDLRDADLRTADLLGADLRGADLRGADLRGVLFLTRPQLAAARGGARTRIPAGFDRPGHWAA
jgi:hypothetical protein